MVRGKDRSARSAMAYRMAMQQGVLWAGRSKHHGVGGVLRSAARLITRPFVLLFHGMVYVLHGIAGAHRSGRERTTPGLYGAENARPSRQAASEMAAELAPSTGNGAWALKTSAIVSSCALAAFAIAFCVYLSLADGRPHALIVDAGAMAEVVLPQNMSPAQLLDQYGVAIGEHDRILVDAHGDDEIIRISRFFPTFVQIDGDIKKAWMNMGTVGDALNKAGVLLREEDLVIPSLDTHLFPGISVEVVRVEREILETFEVIEFKTIRKDDASIEKGKREIVQKGVDGERKIVTELVYHNGELYSQEVVSNDIIQEQQTLIVHNGTKPKATVKPSAKATPTPAKRYTKAESISKPDAHGIVTIVVGGKSYKAKPMVVESTAYTYTGRKTATGTTTKLGTVAVDRDIIKLGTKMFIPGYGMGKAEDVGVGGHQIDVFMETTKQALRWGRKYDLTIYILQ